MTSARSLEAGWVDEASVTGLARVTEKPESIVYGPLAESRVTPDVVLLRINGLGLMTLKDAFPEILLEGKPQCHIVAMARSRTPSWPASAARSAARGPAWDPKK